MRLSRSKKPFLPTPAETRLLQALWPLESATVEQIVTSFPEGEQPNYKTTQTLLRIMENKGFITHVARGKVFVFSPLVTEQEVARCSVGSLLQQNFGGSASGLLVNLLETDGLESSDLREMEELIRRFREQRESSKSTSAGDDATPESLA
jgi:BlaI family penicillinase repressor